MVIADKMQRAHELRQFRAVYRAWLRDKDNRIQERIVFKTMNVLVKRWGQTEVLKARACAIDEHERSLKH